MTLRAALFECNNWGANEFGGDIVFLGQVQGAMRYVYALGMEHSRVFGQVPYLLARLRQPGVRARALLQFDAAPEEAHDDVTLHFLSPTQRLRAHVDAMGDDGAGISPELDAELKAIEWAPLDDTAAEAPHAIVKKIQDHSRAAGWPRAASTARLKQNLVDVDNFRFAGIQQQWDSFSSVLRPPGARRKRARLKVKRRIVHQRFYTMAHCRFAEALDQDDLVPDDQPPEDPNGPANDNGDDPPSAPPPPHGPHDEEESDDNDGFDTVEAPDEDGDDGDDDSDDGGGDGGGNAKRVRKRLSADDEDVQLMRQYLNKALQPLSYISMTVTNDERVAEDDPAEKVFAFQVLKLEGKTIRIQIYQDRIRETLLQKATVQELEVWMEKSEGGHRTLDVFPLTEPGDIDILPIAGVDRAGVTKILVWQPSISDVDGCVRLEHPEVARPKLPLTSRLIPPLVLMEELEKQGVRAVRHTIQRV